MKRETERKIDTKSNQEKERGKDRNRKRGEEIVRARERTFQKRL